MIYQSYYKGHLQVLAEQSLKFGLAWPALKFAEWVMDTSNRNKLKGEVYGPVITCLKLKDPRYAAQVRSIYWIHSLLR